MPLSLVAFYGDKPEGLTRLITRLQEPLLRRLGAGFRPYSMQQVHATILGLEAMRKPDGIYHQWYTANRGQAVAIDLTGLVIYLREELPVIRLQIGGFRPDLEYAFSSRGQHPFFRSFSIQGQMVVAMGWPVQLGNDGPDYPASLFALRQSFEAFYLCHKWHQNGYQDNDLFFVLGKVATGQVPAQTLEQLTAELRQELQDNPVRLQLDRSKMAIVAYEDTELPLASSRVILLDDQLSVSLLDAFYT